MRRVSPMILESRVMVWWGRTGSGAGAGSGAASGAADAVGAAAGAAGAAEGDAAGAEGVDTGAAAGTEPQPAPRIPNTERKVPSLNRAIDVPVSGDEEC